MWFSKKILLTTFILFSPAVRAIDLELNDGTRLTGVKPIQRKQLDSELTVLGFIVGSAHLSDVQKKFKGLMSHTGDAGTSAYDLCYAGEDGLTMKFESSGEMGGPDHVITYAKVAIDLKDKSNCQPTKIRKDDIKINGIKIGMSSEQVIKLLGIPSKNIKDVLLYFFDATKKVKGMDFNVTSSLEIRLLGNSVSQVSLMKIESN
jgi:hypothetical protein